jgi:hypothetical protein
MAQRRALGLTDDNCIEGLRVVGFQGAVDPASTPAQRAPIIVDGEERLSRIVDFQPGRAIVESIEPPLPAEGPLPGVATRFGPFPALLNGVVAIVGRSERPLVHKIDVGRPDLPPRVAGFLRWLRDDHQIPDDAPYRRAGEGLWACYLTVPERYALWKALHSQVYRSLREAVREDDSERMTADAFWLSRVVVDPETDLFKAAEALRRAGSEHWKFMLREGLRLKDEASWEKGLKEAAYAFDDHRETAPESRPRYRARDAVRQGAANQ